LDVERAQAQVDLKTRSITEIEARIREHDESEKKIREEHAALESRRATLQELKDKYEGYDESVRSLVAGPTRPERILGTVGDVLHASGDWLPALEASLGEGRAVHRRRAYGCRAEGAAHPWKRAAAGAPPSSRWTGSPGRARPRSRRRS